MVLQILFGLVCVNPDEFFQFSVSNTRGHCYKLYIQRSYHSARLSFFSERIINIWNDLPSNIMDFISLSSFRQGRFFWLFDLTYPYYDFAVCLHFAYV